MPDLFEIPPPSSGGLILSYQCSNQCRHCLYACSPGYQDWITEEDITIILSGLKKHGRFLTGLHIAGGEPMLKPEKVEIAAAKGATTVLLQGGHNPKVGLGEWQAYIAAIQKACPQVHIHPFSPAEIAFMAGRENCSVRKV